MTTSFDAVCDLEDLFRRIENFSNFLVKVHSETDTFVVIETFKIEYKEPYMFLYIDESKRQVWKKNKYML